MKTIETTLCVIELTDQNSGGTALEKAVREMFKQYDHSLIASGNIDYFKRELTANIDGLLEEHKAWKKMELTESDYFISHLGYRQIELGIVGMRFRPAKNILIIGERL